MRNNIKKDSFTLWQNERKLILSDLSDYEREVIEKKITLEILKVFKKRKGDYFYYEDLEKIKLLNDNFPIMVITGDRNIGKTTSSKRLSLKNKFILLRNIQEEVKEQIRSDEEHFLVPNLLEYDNIKTPNITNKSGKIVGYYRDVNTIGKFKSIEFPDVNLIIWEEFNSRVKCSDKFAKAIEFFTTVQRHREDLKIIMQANYVNQNDEILQKLGVGLKKITNNTIVKFNWIAGAINIFIPKSIYKSTSNKKKQLGYRLSLLDHETWKSQFGGEFDNETLTNIVNMKEISHIEPQFNIFHLRTHKSDFQAFKMTLYIAYDNDGKPFNFLTKTIGSNDKLVFTFDFFNSVKYINSHLLSLEKLDSLIMLWQNDCIKTDSIETHNNIITLFASGKKIIASKNELITEVEEI